MMKSSPRLRTRAGWPMLSPGRILKTSISILKFEDGHPEEEAIIVYFKHLRLEKKNSNVINLDTLLLHQQCHEEKVRLEAADPPQDHNDNQGGLGRY